MAIQKTEGFILKTYDFREKSKIALFYTREFGRIKGILKGIKENKKNFSTTLEPASKNEIIFYPSRESDLHLITGCDLITDFGLLRKDLKKMVISDCFLELINSIMPLEEKSIPVFDLLDFSLSALNKGICPEMLWIFFQIKSLKLTGFKPHLDCCILCERDISDSVYFSLNYGGLLCMSCKEKDKNARRLLKGALASLLYMEKIDFEKFYSFKLNSKIRYELRDLLKRFIEFHSEIRIKSEKLLVDKLIK